MATETLSPRHSGDMAGHPIVLDTSVSDTPIPSLTASPMPKTAVPNDPEPQDHDDSGSDYSDDEFESPANSRPISLMPPTVEENEIADVDAGEVVESPSDSQHMSSGRVSQSKTKVDEEDATEGAVQSEALSQQPAGSQKSIMEMSDTFEDVPLQSDQDPTTLSSSESDNVLPAGLEEQVDKPDLAIDTSPRRKSTTPQRQTPTIEISDGTASPDGSDYSGSPSHSPGHSPRTPSVPISPMTPHEAHMSMDSLQSIALSETSLDYDNLSSEQVEDVLATPRVRGARHTRKPSSLDILQNTWGPPVRQETLFDLSRDEPLDTPSVGVEDQDDPMDATNVWLTESGSSLHTMKRESSSSGSDLELDWDALDMTEEQEKEDRDLPEGAEDETTAFLLARLEQENAKFSADPKSSVGSAVPKNMSRIRSQSRPPSMALLKKMVSKGPAARYSIAPSVQEHLSIEEPPPMTEMEYWVALVQDYPTTASRLPTLTTTKIRAGIPPPLRGVVWTSMSGAREKSLEDAFEKLKDEQSPYEGIINKDVGRSFPGVDLFRDADGEGQRMLGRVLKCFSLYDKDIGYCQGLGFLVGPLLMNMGEKEAFCVLVRLMDHYALRPSFLPSLSGLHMRIFQFSTLLKQHHPRLSEHLTELGVEPAYLSQWFLSCFAVTCPLSMLFRIYDVIFAEGANETVMRVALALFRRNEEKMLASHEFEEVMQLLLGRAIWDVYGMNSDDLIDDFTSLGNIITHQRLAELEKEFENKDSDGVGQSAGFLPDVQAAASRFLGRLWAPTHAHTPSKGASATLSPASAEKDAGTPMSGILSRPGTFLRRSPSKTSIGTINESGGSDGSGSNSVASTAPTDPDIHDLEARDSQADSASMKSKKESLRTVSISTSQAAISMAPGVREQQELHSQIEDLLMALSEMQREHAQMAAMLQKEREERNDDHRVVRKLMGKLGRGRPRSHDLKDIRRSLPPTSTNSSHATHSVTDLASKRQTLPARPRPEVRDLPQLLDVEEKPEPPTQPDDDFDELVHEVQARLDSNARFSASFETKAQLRSNLARTREQLAAAENQIKNLSERAEFTETSLMTFQNESESLHSEVEELRTRVNDDFKEKQKLELIIQNMELQMRMDAKALENKQRKGWMTRGDSSGDVPTINKVQNHERSRTGSISSQPSSAGGLRELKLGRRDSVGSIQSIRSMKSQRQTSEWPQSPPAVTNTSPSPPLEQAEVFITETPPSVPAKPVVTPQAPPPPTLNAFQPPPRKSSHTPSPSLSVPMSGSFGQRTSSLATKEVLSTTKHEPVPDEALLIELVNAKTSEAQARQENDELRRSLQVQKRRTEEMLQQIQAEVAAAKLEAEAARVEAEKARDEAKAARSEVFDATPMATPIGMFTETPTAVEEDESEQNTPARKPLPKKSETAPAAAGGGWFWSRRTASTTKAVMDKLPEEK